MTNNKQTRPIIIFFIIVAVAGGAWLVAKRNSLYVSYANKVYGYRLSVPKSLPLNDSNPAFVTIGKVAYEPAPGSMVILVKPRLPVGQIYPEIGISPSDDEGCKSGGSIKFGSQAGSILNCVAGFDGSAVRTYVVEKNDLVFVISYIERQGELDPQFEQIIQSLRFL